MLRLAVTFGCLFLFASSALATSTFSRYWKEEYLNAEKADEEFIKLGKKAGCYVCHIKGHEDKKKARNEYGKSVQEYLKEKDFPKEWVKENPEEAKKKILEGVKKANEHKSSDGDKFGDKLKNNKLPATDANL